MSRNRTNNGIERIKREIRRRTRVVGTFSDGKSALMLVTARVKCIVEHEWGKRRYLDMSKLEEMDDLRGKAEVSKKTRPGTAKSICERILAVPNESCRYGKHESIFPGTSYSSAANS